jgi:large subunit ribosomal protein L17
MRHRVKKRHLNRDTNHRKALLMNLVRSLIEHGSIETTEAKAKEARRLADKLISTAKTNSIANRRELHKFFGKRDAVNTLVDRVAPLMKKRTSGFTTLATSGKRRGDNVAMFRLSLIEKPDRLGTLKSGEEFKNPVKKKTKKIDNKKTGKQDVKKAK